MTQPDTTQEVILAAAKALKGKKVKATVPPNITVTGKLLKATRDCVEFELPGGGIWRTPKILAIEEATP